MNASVRQDRPSLSGNVIPAAHVRVVHSHATPDDEPASPPAAPPRVTLIKDGDIVRAIEIVCSCGEVTRLDCEY